MNISVRRHILGIISIFTLTAAGILLFAFDDNDTKMAGSMCLRVGIGLGLIWLALPQILGICSKLPPRLMIAVIIGGVVGLARPRSLPVIVLIVGAVAVLEFVGWMLTPLPRKKRRGSGQKPKR